MKLRPQLLIGSLSLTVLILFMGLYGIFSLNRISEFTRAMYDGPLMSINFARSAQYDFSRIEAALSNLAAATDDRKREALIAEVGEYRETFTEDLGIAGERAKGTESQAAIKRIRAALVSWDNAWRELRTAYSNDDLAAAASPQARVVSAIEVVNEEIEVLVEFAAQEGYDFRGMALDQSQSVIQLNWIIVVVGILGGILLGLLMAWRIVNPTVRITNILRELSANERNVDIPETGRKDEIGDIARAAATFQRTTIRFQDNMQKANADLEEAAEEARKANHAKSDFPGQDEPRTPYAPQRYHWLQRDAARRGGGHGRRGIFGRPDENSVRRQAPAGPDQRHPRSFQNRGRANGSLFREIRGPSDDQRSGQHDPAAGGKERQPARGRLPR